jgi:hypothetical protein
MDHELNQSCKDRFDKIDERLDKGDSEFKQHGEKLVELKTDMTYLAKSLDGVTKALWTVAFFNCDDATWLFHLVYPEHKKIRERGITYEPNLH